MKTANKPMPKSELSIGLEALEEAIGLLIEHSPFDVLKDYIQKYRPTFSELIERAILTRGNAMDAVRYAEIFIKGRWPEGESRIVESVDNFAILRYAIDVLNGRWQEGEQVLLAGGWFVEIMLYAKDAIQGRWPEGERLILADGNDHYLEQYATTVLPGNWDQDVASKCTCWTYYYFKDVIKGKLPEELHNRMIWAYAENKHDPWCKKYFAAKKSKRVRKPC